MQPKVLGILGGLGPMATVYFYELLTRHTKAQKDQDHIDVIINSRATTPDRTAFIVGESTQNPFDIMVQDAQRLVTYGADVLAIPCNTAHYFYDMLNESIQLPILNMVEETVISTKERNFKKIAILATNGTVSSGTYQRVCEKHNLPYAVPNEQQQNDINDIIYNNIKQGEKADMQKFNAVVSSLQAQGCDCVLLGCTELSLIKKEEHLPAYFIDSMEVLAKNAIIKFGKTPIGFDF